MIEPAYEEFLKLRQRKGPSELGLMAAHTWEVDPKRLGFTLARYKFVAKMLTGCDYVLEVGCGDAWATRIVSQAVKSVTAIDIDPLFIGDAQVRWDPKLAVWLCLHDILAAPLLSYNGAFALDVLEHIAPDKEQLFIGNMVKSLTKDGVCIIGTPSLESQIHASPLSKAGHINCKSGEQLRSLMQQWFANVFMFSMHDEVVHTGFLPMAQYLFALCCGPKRL